MKKDFKFRDILKKNLFSNYKDRMWNTIEINIHSIIRNKLSRNVRLKINDKLCNTIWNIHRDNIEFNIRNIKMREIINSKKWEIK